MDFNNIIFRGQQPSDKTWIFGDLGHTSTEMYISVNIKTWHLHDDPIIDFGSDFYIDSKTVGVNFGQKDINDKLIFTGDIVKDEDNDIYKVMADEYLFLEDISNKHAPIMLNNFSAVILQLQVIGNIYDNPELLNK